ncbi:MAG TPA: hypothetical protein VJ505_16395 [Holophagaceae bacterium]|nr:hypothetical protein [Holophagaceae bacterium]
MRWILLLLLLLLPGCRPAEPVPPPPVARLTLHFLDQDGELRLQRIPAEGVWAYMDAGVWRPLDLLWKEGGRRGIGVVPRTAPIWVLLKDPEGEIHRIVMWDEPDLVGPRVDGLADEEREWLTAVGLLWVLQWIRR